MKRQRRTWYRSRERLYRDRDRHDVWYMVAWSDDLIYGGRSYDEPWCRIKDVIDRGLYEHVGRNRRTERAKRYLAGVGEYADGCPF